MQSLGFGQPTNGVIQMAYIVDDIRAAIDRWTEDMKAGPWYLLEGGALTGSIYRGAPCTASNNLAMGFAGHMQIELIQPLGDTPSIFREVALDRGYGFHHYGVACTDVEAETARMIERGYSKVFEIPVPTGGTVVYLESPDDKSGFRELIPVNATLDKVFTGMWESSRGWDGRERIRPFASAFEAAGA